MYSAPSRDSMDEKTSFGAYFIAVGKSHMAQKVSFGKVSGFTKSICRNLK